jgi:hypothetical protein
MVSATAQNTAIVLAISESNFVPTNPCVNVSATVFIFDLHRFGHKCRVDDSRSRIASSGLE